MIDDRWQIDRRLYWVERICTFAALTACGAYWLQRGWLWVILSYTLLIAGQVAGWLYARMIKRIVAPLLAETAAVRADSERIREETRRKLEQLRAGRQ